MGLAEKLVIQIAKAFLSWSRTFSLAPISPLIICSHSDCSVALQQPGTHLSLVKLEIRVMILNLYYEIDIQV